MIMYGKKSSELLLSMRKKFFSWTFSNESYQKMQRAMLYNFHMIAYFIALVFCCRNGQTLERFDFEHLKIVYF